MPPSVQVSDIKREEYLKCVIRAEANCEVSKCPMVVIRLDTWGSVLPRSRRWQRPEPRIVRCSRPLMRLNVEAFFGFPERAAGNMQVLLRGGFELRPKARPVLEFLFKKPFRLGLFGTVAPA